MTNFSDATRSIFSGVEGALMQRQFTYGLRQQPIFLVAGELNEDGARDTVVRNCGAANVRILDGPGNTPFSNSDSNKSNGSATPDGEVVENFNGDGKLDVAVANQGTETLALVLNSRSGRFAFGDQSHF